SSLFHLLSASAPSFVYTLSLHDALPISSCSSSFFLSFPPGSPPSSLRPYFRWILHPHPLRLRSLPQQRERPCPRPPLQTFPSLRSEEHTSELQSRFDLVCRLLLE